MTRLLPALFLVPFLTTSVALADPALVQVSADPAYTQLEYLSGGESRFLNTCTIMLTRPVKDLKTMRDLQQVTGFVHLPLHDQPLPPGVRKAMGKTPEVIFEIERMEPAGAPEAAKQAKPAKGKKAEPEKPGLLASGKVFDMLIHGSVHVGNIRYQAPPIRSVVLPSEAGLAIQSRTPITLKWPEWPAAQEAKFTLFLTRD